MSELPDLKERVRAQTALDSTLLVEAAAGTGKTALLAGRVSMALMSGASPREIVAITFTQAAADELAIRIQRYVRELHAGVVPDCLRPALPEGPNSSHRAHLDEAAQTMDELTVTTIHGFCQKFILSYAVEANIDPGAKMMDAQQAESEFEAVFRRFVHRRLNSSSGPDDPIEALSEEDPTYVVGALRSLAYSRRDHRTASAVSADLSTRLDEKFSDAVSAFSDAASRMPPESTIVGLLTDLRTLSEMYGDCLASVPPFPRLWRLAHPPTLWIMGRESFDLIEPAWGSLWKSVKDKDTVAASRREGERLYTRVKLAYRALYGRIATALCHTLFTETDQILEDYFEFKRAAAVLDFDDLLHRARSLVREHEPVRAALAQRYRHILVDEFQDTDPLQAEILFRIAADEPHEDWHRCQLRPGALFMVGDPKQAIYGFRGADVGSYKRAREAIKARWPDNVIQITANFRSVPGILTYINDRFAATLADTSGQPGYVMLSPVRAAADHVFPCVAKKTLAIDPEAKADPIRDAEAEVVAELCEQLLASKVMIHDKAGKPVPLGPEGIALLTPNHGGLWRYERALEARRLPFASRAGKSLLRRQEVQDMLALARTIADASDTLAFGALMRGPLVGLTDEELLDITAQLPNHSSSGSKVAHFSIHTDPAAVANPLARDTLLILKELHLRAHSTTPALVLSEAVERLSLRPLLAAREGSRRCRATANVERFLALAKPYGTAGLKSFVRDMTVEWEGGRGGRVEGRVDSEGAIELVTMHSSKGLEWPVVILINTVAKVDKRRTFVHRAEDNTLHWVLGDVEPPELASAIEQEGRNSASERQRVWYVACSRARELLIIPAIPPRSKYKPWCQVVENVYDGIPELPSVRAERFRPQRVVEPENQQSIEKFAEEHRRLMNSVRKIRWLTPSEDDPDRVHAETSAVIDATDETPETPAPIGAGRIRGLALHKLLEEVLTGELSETPTALSGRAAQLIGQLAGGPNMRGNFPEASELSTTVQRTLALPEVAAMREKLVPEISIYRVTPGETESIALSGRADAVAIEEGRVSVVVDWKSDVAPTMDDVRFHAQQLRDYITGTGASRGVLVYMTSGKVHWVEGARSLESVNVIQP